jgi:hypothetical protein
VERNGRPTDSAAPEASREQHPIRNIKTTRPIQRSLAIDGVVILHILIVREVALSLVLLMGAGVMIQSLLALRRVDAGFDPNNVRRRGCRADPCCADGQLGTGVPRRAARPGESPARGLGRSAQSSPKRSRRPSSRAKCAGPRWNTDVRTYVDRSRAWVFVVVRFCWVKSL